MALLNAIVESRTSIVGLSVDVDGYPTEQHELRADITTYPIETGADLVDHAVDQPDKLVLTGWASSAIQLSFATELDTDVDLPRRIWYALDQMKRRRELVTVHTVLGTYDNMIIRKLSANIDVTTGQNLPFTAEFQEVLLREDLGSFADPSSTSGPAVNRQALQRRGQQMPTTALEQQLEDTLAEIEANEARDAELNARLEELQGQIEGGGETPDTSGPGFLSLLTFGLVD